MARPRHSENKGVGSRPSDGVEEPSLAAAGSYGTGTLVAEPRPWQSYLSRIRTFDSLRFRDFRLLWLSQGGTSMGMWMDQVARTWLIYEITGSALQLGIVSAVRGVPMLFFIMIGGVVADRYGRKAQLVISQVTNVFLNLILATLVLTGRIEVWHVYVTSLLAGTVQAFQQPARQAIISDLVSRDYLSNAVALNSAMFNLMRSLGPAIAGATIALIGVDGSYYAQAALFVWATVWTIQMRVPGEPGLLELVKLRRLDVLPAREMQESRDDDPSPRAKYANDSFFGSMKEGFEYLLQNHLILWLMLLSLAPVLLGMPYASLMPIFALDILHVGSVGQGMLLSSAGVGALIGALGIASIGNFRRKGMILLSGATMFGLSLVAFSQSTWMPLSMTCLFVVGLSSAAYGSQSQTIIQMLAPAHLRGRVLSIYMLNVGLMPLGSLLAGGLASWLGGPWAVLLMGASCAALALGIAFNASQIRHLDI